MTAPAERSGVPECATAVTAGAVTWPAATVLFAEGASGVLFMTNPGNYNYPEQLRIWPTGQNGGRSNVYINFNPAQDRDWELLPGRSYGLRYRMLVYDGTITAAEAEGHWRDFADPPQVEVTAAP